MVQTAYVALFLMLIGPFVGSFLAVLVDRLPRGENVVSARSSCRSCGKKLGVRHLVPILSFALQRGSCGHCHARIPAWLLYVEILALGAGILAVVHGGGATDIVLNAIFLWLLIALSAADLKWFRLPDLLTACLAVVALALSNAPGGIGLWLGVLGACIGVGAFLVIRIVYQQLRGREGLGLGDVKLMAGLGAFAGPFDLPLLVLLAAAGALAVAVFQLRSSPDALGKDRALPFGAALCMSAAVLWLVA